MTGSSKLELVPFNPRGVGSHCHGVERFNDAHTRVDRGVGAAWDYSGRGRGARRGCVSGCGGEVARWRR